MIDYLVVGSGFGGSTVALRLVERGASVLMLEQGRRFAADDFAESNWQLRRWLWAPRLGMRGPFRMNFLRHVTALSGVGVGGGSLVYANTLEQPGQEFFRAPEWGELGDWHAELEPHYHTARHMLGAARNPRTTPADELLFAEASARGLSERFTHTNAGVFFGEAGVTVADPYFGGAGPARTGCTHCASCMIGCRVGAKNTLDRNYLYLAERQGLEIRAEHEVVGIARVAGGYEVSAWVGSKALGRRRRLESYRARNVVLAAGVLGTTRLLLRVQAAGTLGQLPAALGRHVRTNSEVLLGIVTPDRERDYADGVAITSILRTDERSSAELVRYPAGSGAFRALVLPHAEGRTALGRIGGSIGRALRHPLTTLRAYTVRDFAKHSVILLYMRVSEGTLALDLHGRRLRSTLDTGLPPAAALPDATELGEALARRMNGYTMSLFTEVLFGVPTTAHILGGCVIAESPDRGVVDHRHEVFGQPGLYVVDGSAVPANPGVNPSLTITALAERAVRSWT